MGWFASLIVMVAEKLLEALGQDILDYIKKERLIEAARAEQAKAAAASVQPLKEAKTGQEVSDATHNALDGT